MGLKNENPQNEMALSETLCTCSGTTRGQIQKLFSEGLDIEAISRWTGALTGCGGCEWDIQQFLKELKQSQLK
jgi:bacterioferritin-associated ferredoxin